MKKYVKRIVHYFCGRSYDPTVYNECPYCYPKKK